MERSASPELKVKLPMRVYSRKQKKPTQTSTIFSSQRGCLNYNLPDHNFVILPKPCLKNELYADSSMDTQTIVNQHSGIRDTEVQQIDNLTAAIDIPNLDSRNQQEPLEKSNVKIELDIGPTELQKTQQYNILSVKISQVPDVSCHSSMKSNMTSYQVLSHKTAVPDDFNGSSSGAWCDSKADIQEFELKPELDIEPGPSELELVTSNPHEIEIVKSENKDLDDIKSEAIEQDIVKSKHNELDAVRPEQDCSVEVERSPAVLSMEWGQILRNRLVVQQPKKSTYNVTSSSRGTLSVNPGMEECKVKQELDIEPTVLQPPDIYFTMLNAINSESVVLDEDDPGPHELESLTSNPRQLEIVKSKNLDGIKCKALQQDITKSDPKELYAVRLVQDRDVLVKSLPAVLSEECGQILRNTSELQKHKCSCDVSRDVKNEAFPDHIPRHTNSHSDSQEIRQNQCTQCKYKTSTDSSQYSASSKINLAKQTKNHTRNKFKCAHCKFSTFFKKLLIKHLNSHTGDKPYRCAHCEFSTSWKRSIIKHLMLHNGKKPFKCSFCKYNAPNKNRFKEHLRVHTKEKPFKCTQCEYSTSYKRYFAKHSIKHTEKHLKCTQCDYRTYWKSKLIEHSRLHTGVKPFKCSHCQYKTHRKCNLTKHLQWHNSESLFKCTICQYNAYSKIRLTDHLRWHAGDKPFKCAQCEYSTSYKSLLNTHSKIHSGGNPFKCTYCEYSTFTHYRLVVHSRLHTVKKPHRCTFCEYIALNKSNLIQHLRVHTKEKPFRCTQCEYRTSYKYQVVVHTRLEHGET